MDASPAGQEYVQLGREFLGVVNTIQTLDMKLQAAAQGGDGNAAEWLVGYEQIALDVKAAQTQVDNLLEAIRTARIRPSKRWVSPSRR
jgi:hypothetical protein